MYLVHVIWKRRHVKWIDFANSYYLIQTNWRKFILRYEASHSHTSFIQYIQKEEKSSHFLQQRAVCKENKNAE